VIAFIGITLLPPTVILTKARPHEREPGMSMPTPGWAFVHVCIDDASRIAFSQTSLRDGYTPAHTQPQSTESRRSNAGSTTTTGIDRTAACDPARPSVAALHQ